MKLLGLRMSSAMSLVTCLITPTIVRAQATQSETPPAANGAVSKSAPVTVAPKQPGRATAPAFVGPYPAEGADLGPLAGGPYVGSRWAEDWSHLRGKEPADPLTRLKYLPMDADGDVSLTLNGLQRLRWDHTSSPGLRSGTDQNQLLSRTAFGADLHLGRHVRAYAEIVNGSVGGWNYKTPGPNQRNNAIIHQAFVDAWVEIPGGGVAGARIGRQEFADGPPLLISTREFPNIRTSQNGVKLWANWRNVRLQAFSFKTTQPGSDGFGDDPASKTERIKGIGAGIVLRRGGKGGADRLFLDPFIYDYENEQRAWGGVRGIDHRTTIGARLWGKIDRVDMDWTIAHQSGSFTTATRNSDVDTWGIFTSQDVLLAKTPLQPRVGFNANYASGGGAYDSGTLKSFNYMYGQALLLSTGTFFSATNLKVFAPTFSLRPAKRVLVGAEAQLLWRNNERDAIYNAPGIAYAGTQLVDGKRLGTLYRLNLRWAINPRVTAIVFAEHLDAGPVFTRAGYSSSNYLGTTLNLRF